MVAVYLWNLSAGHDHLRVETLKQAGQRAVQLADAKAGEMQLLLGGADLLLREFRDHYALGKTPAVFATVRAGMTAFPKGAIVHFSVVNAQGYIEFSTLDLPAPVYVGDRDYFKFHAASSTDRLYINKPFEGRTTHGWVALLTRPIFKAGRFAGVAVMSLAPGYVAQSLAQQVMAADDVVGVTFEDGTYLARSRDLAQALGRQWAGDRPPLPSGAPVRDGAGLRSVADERPRLYGWRHLTGYPLKLYVGLDERTVLAPADQEIRRSIRRNAVALPLLSLLVLAVSGLLFRSARQQERLIAGQALLKATFESTADGILIVGGDRRILTFNHRFRELWGLPDALVRTASDRELLAQVSNQLESPHEFLRTVEALYETDEQRLDIVRFADGRAFERHTRTAQLDDQRARLWSFRDVTQRWRAEQALRRSETRARGIFEGARDGILLADTQSHRFVDANPAVCALLGYTKDELLARGVTDIHPGAELPRVLATFERQARGEIVIAEDIPVLRRDGSVFYADISVAAIQLDGRDCMAGFFRDITERRRADEELERHRHQLEAMVERRTHQLADAKEAAEAANLAKSAFLANMSHEIRTPLNAITGLTDLMKRDGATPQQSDRLTKIATAGRHLLEVINAVLDMSKIESGKFVLEESVVDVASIVANAAALMRERAEARQLQLVTDVPALPKDLLGDATRLLQALLNYLSNAVKFTHAGRITLRAATLAEDEDAVLLRFEVQDTGIGISAVKLATLYTAFEQADNSITREYGGTGLGLAITRRLAQLMGGDAGATSVPGAGSRFWFTARLRRAASNAVAAVAPRLESAEEGLRRRHRGRLVLLVEDEPINREITSGLLEIAGLVVEAAHDGAQAVERAARRGYDLILMDMQMPGMDGLQATRRVRAGDLNRRTPVLALTANAFSEDRARCLAAGMNDFVTKPAESETLFAAVLRWLDAPR
ncbi:MAG: PAS domain S-box protein [Burkholderiales bacterium]|nr:PAS domain S-box protein [Burkholderiales bacterium]MDE1928108.1 PAS domain S-box protein [Burkholderiales bacterium]